MPPRTRMRGYVVSMLSVLVLMFSFGLGQTKEALQRMEEMRQLIGKRGAEGVVTPRSRPRSVVAVPHAAPATPTAGAGPSTNPGYDLPAWTQHVGALANDAERDVARAASSHETLQTDLRLLAADLKEVRNDACFGVGRGR